MSDPDYTFDKYTLDQREAKHKRLEIGSELFAAALEFSKNRFFTRKHVLLLRDKCNDWLFWNDTSIEYKDK